MLDAVANTARKTIDTILAIKDLLQRTKQQVRASYKFSSHGPGGGLKPTL
jgi:hypothetical protein